MADVTMGFEYTIKDGSNVSAPCHMSVIVPDTTTLAALRAHWVDIGTLLDAATDGKVAAGRITFSQPGDAAFKANAVPGSLASAAALIEFSMLNTTHQASVSIPAVKATARSTGRLDINAAGVKEFIYGCYHGMGTGDTLKITNLTGNSPTGVNKGFLGPRKHRKQTQSKTVTDGSTFVPPA